MVKVNANLHDESDVGAMCGPTVQVTSGSDGMSVELVQFGTVHGGVWHNDYSGWGWTCPACDTCRAFCRDAESADAALRDHQRRQCEARRDGGVSDSDLKASARRIDALRTAADLERDGDQQ